MPTTIYSQTLAGDSDSSAISQRNVCPITGGAQDQVRVTLKAGTINSLVAQNVSIGISNGTNSDTTAVPTELLFSGASGCNISTGASLTSDWVNFNGFTSTDKLVVVFDCSGTSHAAFISPGPSGSGTYFKSPFGATYNLAAPAGMTFNGADIVAVATIETQTSGPGAPPLIAGFSSPIVRRGRMVAG